MIVVVPVGFKIRTRIEALQFMNKCMGVGSFSIVTDDKTQYIVEKFDDGNVRVSIRKGDLTNIFNPELVIADTASEAYEQTVQAVLWQIRKYINRKYCK